MKVVVGVVGTEEVRRKLAAIGKRSAERVLAATAEEVEEYIGEQAAKHTKTGVLFRSVTKVQLGPLAWLVGHDSSAPHALFVHWGTKPHVIRPRKKKVLRWPVAAGAAGYRFARVVHHPGTKADTYLLRAAATPTPTWRRS